MISEKYNAQMGNYLAKLAQAQTNISASAKPHTNADRIRAMSDEELAEYMNHGACPPGRDVLELCYDEDGGSVPDKCNLCWLNWLRQEVSDGQN